MERQPYETEVILTAMFYALWQAYSSDSQVLDIGDESEEPDSQCAVLLLHIDRLCKEWGVDEVMLNSIYWCYPDINEKIRNTSMYKVAEAFYSTEPVTEESIRELRNKCFGSREVSEE